MEPRTERKTRPKLENYDSINTIKKVNIFAKINNPLSKFIQNHQISEQVKKDEYEKSDKPNLPENQEQVVHQQVNSSPKVIKRTCDYLQKLPKIPNIKQSWKQVSSKLNAEQIAKIQISQRQKEILETIQHTKQKLQYCELVQYTQLKKTQFQIQVLELIKLCRQSQEECTKKRDYYILKIQENQRKKQKKFQLQKINQNILDMQNQNRSIEVCLQQAKNKEYQHYHILQQYLKAFQEKVQQEKSLFIMLKKLQSQNLVKRKIVIKQKFQIQMILEQKAFISCYKKYAKDKIKNKVIDKDKSFFNFKYDKSFQLKPSLSIIELKTQIQLALSLYFFLKTCFVTNPYQILTSLSYSSDKLKQLYRYEDFIIFYERISKQLKQKASQYQDQKKYFLNHKLIKIENNQQNIFQHKSELQTNIIIFTKYVDLTIYFLQVFGCKKIFEKEQQHYLLVSAKGQILDKVILVLFENEANINSFSSMQSTRYIFRAK